MPRWLLLSLAFFAVADLALWSAQASVEPTTRCAHPRGAQLIEQEDGQRCVAVLMSDGVQFLFCEARKGTA